MSNDNVSDDVLSHLDEVFFRHTNEEYAMYLVHNHLEVLQKKIDKLHSFLDGLVLNEGTKVEKLVNTQTHILAGKILTRIEGQVLLPEEINRWVRSLEKTYKAKYKKKTKTTNPGNPCHTTKTANTKSKNPKKTSTGSVITRRNKPSFWRKLKDYWNVALTDQSPPVD